MRVITLKSLRNFYLRHPAAAPALKSWVQEARSAAWKTPQDIKNQFISARFLRNNRVVFNIKGNDYRLVVATAYQLQAIYVKFIGTYAEYDAIDAATVEME